MWSVFPFRTLINYTGEEGTQAFGVPGSGGHVGALKSSSEMPIPTSQGLWEHSRVVDEARRGLCRHRVAVVAAAWPRACRSC